MSALALGAPAEAQVPAQQAQRVRVFIDCETRGVYSAGAGAEYVFDLVGRNDFVGEALTWRRPFPPRPRPWLIRRC